MMATLLISGLLAGCAVSAETIQEQFDAYVAEHQTCEGPGDCEVIYPGCPLGCWAVVSEDDAEEAQDYAEQLISQYERGGRSCDYSCAEPSEVDCIEQTCTFVDGE